VTEGSARPRSGICLYFVTPTQSGATPTTPNVLDINHMSGYTDDAIVQHGILEPGLAFIQKPFSGEALARRIREVLAADAPPLV
jgi:hypothetical protein